MTDFLLFCLASVGMTQILVKGEIFLPLRLSLANEAKRIQRRREKKGLPPAFSLIGFFHKLSECLQCTGFWCGIFCGLFFVSSDTMWISLENVGIRYLVNRVLMLFCCGAAGAFLAPMGDILVDLFFFTKEFRFRELVADDRRRAEAAEQQNAEAAPEQAE